MNGEDFQKNKLCDEDIEDVSKLFLYLLFRNLSDKFQSPQRSDKNYEKTLEMSLLANMNHYFLGLRCLECVSLG